MSTSGVQNPLRATFLRGGTSKGIFINRENLPEDKSEWDRIFLGIMGSPDAEYGRQLNGMGGGVSSLSKICVVGEASPQLQAKGYDVEYTFVQVGIRDSVIDYSGNCGNLASMIGVYAMDEGLCPPSTVRWDVGTGSATATVCTFNTNTNKRIDVSFPIAVLITGTSTAVLDLPQVAIAGVPGKASQITLDFMNPGGARTRHLLPTSSPLDILEKHVHSEKTVPLRASLVDATNPTVFISGEDIQQHLAPPGEPVDYTALEPVLEEVRQLGAKRMGLDPSAQAQPKIAVLSDPVPDDADGADVVVHAYSMGVLHKAVPMTVGLCLGVAAGIKGTLAWDIVRRVRAARSKELAGEMVRIRHPGGVVDVGASFGKSGKVLSAKVVRTGKRLMDGVVWW